VFNGFGVVFSNKQEMEIMNNLRINFTLNLFLLIILFNNNPILAHVADPEPNLAPYSIFGDQFLDFRNEAETQDKGWIGTNGYLAQGSPYNFFKSIIKVNGDFNAGTNDGTTYDDTIYVRSTSNLTGDLSLTKNLIVKDDQFPNPKLPTFSKADILVGSNDVIVENGKRSLAPGSYGKIETMRDDDTIFLDAGEYHIDSLIIRGVMVVSHSEVGYTRIFVKSKVHFLNAGRGHKLQTDSDSLLGKVLLYTTGDLETTDGSRMDATVIAINDTVHLSTGIVINGQLFAKAIIFENGFSGNDGTFVSFIQQGVSLPANILDGVEEDPNGEPDIDNSYLLSFPLSISAPLSSNSKLSYEILSTSKQAPVAEEGSDFFNSSQGAIKTGEITFPAGDTISNSNISIWIIDDSYVEPDEFITVRLFGADDSLGFENSETTIEYSFPITSEDTVTDSLYTPYTPMVVVFPDTVLDGVLEDRQNEKSVDNSYLLRIPITLSDKSDYSSKLNYEVLGTSSISPSATAGSDFFRSTLGAVEKGVVNFESGSSTSSDTISIWIIDDTYKEEDEYLTVKLSSPDSLIFSNGEEEIEYSFAITSEDIENDSTYTPYLPQTVTFPSNVLDGVEEDIKRDQFTDNSYLLTIPIELTGVSSYNGSFDYELLTASNIAPAATENVDFSASNNGANKSGTINFTKGSSSSKDSISIWIIDDSLVETPENISIKFSSNDSVAFSNGENEIVYSFKIISEDQEMSEIYAKFSSGFLFDKWGKSGFLDGIADSGVISIELGTGESPLDMEDLTKIEINSDGQNFSIDNWSVESETEVTFRDTTLVGITGESNVVLSFSSVAVNGVMSDSVAPVIISAAYDKWGAGNDSLSVTFSEELSKTGTLTPFSFHSGTNLKLSYGRKSGSNVYYGVTEGVLSGSDSIWITPQQDIVDNKGVEQIYGHNQRVPISTYSVKPVLSTYYSETDEVCDGYIDQIGIQLPIEVNGELAEKIIDKLELSNLRNFIKTGKYSIVNSELLIAVEQSKEIPANTGTDSGDTLKLSSIVRSGEYAIVTSTPLLIQDSLAPVILGGSYLLGRVETGSTTITDTLVVTYSEAVNPLESKYPFGFLGKNGEYKIEPLGDSSGQVVSYTVLFDKNSIMPENGDSIWIDRDGFVSDISRNIQERNTIPAPLVVGEIPANFDVLLYPNPLRKSGGTFENEYIISVSDLPASNRVALVVAPKGIRSLQGDVECEVDILDAVGNLVNHFDYTMMEKGNSGEHIFSLKPENRSGRELASGSYLMSVTFKGVYSGKLRVMLGIAE
jgi:hypothetical protein